MGGVAIESLSQPGWCRSYYLRSNIFHIPGKFNRELHTGPLRLFGKRSDTSALHAVSSGVFDRNPQESDKGSLQLHERNGNAAKLPKWLRLQDYNPGDLQSNAVLCG